MTGIVRSLIAVAILFKCKIYNYGKYPIDDTSGMNVLNSIELITRLIIQINDGGERFRPYES